MAGTKLMWVLQLQDQMSAPAGKAERALAKLQARTERMQRAERATAGRAARAQEVARTKAAKVAERTERARAAAGAASHVDRGEAVGALGAVLSTVGALAAVAAAAVLRVGTAFVSAAHQAIVFRERAMNTLRTVLQSGASAERVFADSQRIARMTPFETTDVVEQRVRLIAADFTEDQSRTLQAALSDVRALFGESRSEMLTSAFERIQNGGLSGEVLEELRNSRLGTGEIIASLARGANITGSNPQELQRRVLAAAQQGRIQNSTVIAAILDQVQRRTHSSVLGSFAEQAGATSFEGSVSNLRSSFMDLLESGNIDQMAGVQMLTKGFGELSKILSGDSEVGKRLRAVFYEITDAAGRFFGRLILSGNAEKALLFVVTTVEDIWRRFQSALPVAKAFYAGLSAGAAPLVAVLRQLGVAQEQSKPGQEAIDSWRMFGGFLGGAITVVGGLLGVLYALGSALVRWVSQPLRVAWEALRALVTFITDVMGGSSLRDAGWNAVSGFFEGMTSAFFSFITPITDLFSTVADAARSALDIHSPSRVFEEIGAYTAEGFSIGLEGGNPAASMSTLMDPPAATASGLASGGSSIGSLSIYLDGAGAQGDPQALAELIASKIAELFGTTAPEAT